LIFSLFLGTTSFTFTIFCKFLGIAGDKDVDSVRWLFVYLI